MSAAGRNNSGSGTDNFCYLRNHRDPRKIAFRWGSIGPGRRMSATGEDSPSQHFDRVFFWESR